MHLFIESLESRCLLSGGSPLISATASMLSPAIHAARSAAPSVNLVGTWIGSYDTTDGFTGSVAVVVKSQGKSSASGTLYIDGVPYRGTAKLTTGLNGAFTLTYKQKGFWGVVVGQVVGNSASGSYTYQIGKNAISNGSFDVSK